MPNPPQPSETPPTTTSVRCSLSAFHHGEYIGSSSPKIGSSAAGGSVASRPGPKSSSNAIQPPSAQALVANGTTHVAIAGPSRPRIQRPPHLNSDPVPSGDHSTPPARPAPSPASENAPFGPAPTHIAHIHACEGELEDTSRLQYVTPCIHASCGGPSTGDSEVATSSEIDPRSGCRDLRRSPDWAKHHGETEGV